MRTIEELTSYLSALPNPPSTYKVAVGSMIFTPGDKVLLLERGVKARDAVGKLEGVGGSVHEGESDLYLALQREIKEEIGDVQVEIAGTLGVKILPGDQYPFWVVVDYLCRLISGNPKIMEPGKTVKIHELALKDIRDDQLSLYQKVALETYRKKFGDTPFYQATSYLEIQKR